MKTGLLLVNLGSPTAPDTPAVKTYLREFLSDQNVIELPKWFWQPLLRGIILPLRSWRSATFYQHIWTTSGSPLVAYTQLMTQQVQTILPDWDVRYAMTYGGPHITATLQAMAQDGCDHTIVVPLYPQYTQSTHQTIIEAAEAAQVPITIVKHFYQEPAYLKLLATKLQTAWLKHDYDAIVFSYHGIPKSMVRHGDPYAQQCAATTAGVLTYVPEIPHEQITTAYQSKFGPAPWLKPYLKNELMQLVELGKRRVLLVTPSFVSDCLETLEEDGVQNYQTFRATGGDTLDLVPPMNADPAFSQFLADLAVKADQGGLGDAAIQRT
ncbi:ferrochelatase [Levilactobacillus acidifarinae]|uniref:Coproporphyrin III ferrochelatase n=1 Tax=Levilactobacillus acidifarinae DSM 19394 = JCM 15949 TaxID=1423715 RepID=A0A0R1LIJ4_9LACO|nr:ferrochelatase [Levilactobacillus acidifarinae]KRK95702.1 ferrochelatase [Levilactobacillus acidifarinae DSM 19394]GEO69438.1 ferrochelatase [Levilactobacillus acidifarinae]